MPEANTLAPRSVAEVLEAAALEVVFQPIVSLPGAETVAFQALIRGPKGTPLESPAVLFGAARAEGLLSELDSGCQEAALRGAMSSGLSRPFGLFVKVEADLRHELPGTLRALYADACSRVRTVVEVTAEAFTAEPGRVLARVRELRRLGCLVALGHVGGGDGCAAAIALVEPDVIKLDMSLVRGADRPSSAVVHAVGAEAWRRGVAVVAEGLEEREHVEVARGMGATFGQGWYFAGSRGLNVIEADALLAPEDPGGRSAHEPLKPATIVADSESARSAARPVLVAMSRHLEEEAMAIGRDALLVARLEHGRFFAGATAKRYAQAASRGTTCFVSAPNLAAEPAPDVRGTALAPGEAVGCEWIVAVVSPHFAAALVAVELKSDGSGSERRFRYVLSYERTTVVALTRHLLARTAEDD